VLGLTTIVRRNELAAVAPLAPAGPVGPAAPRRPRGPRGPRGPTFLVAFPFAACDWAVCARAGPATAATVIKTANAYSLLRRIVPPLLS
jgi:hypothetical protein